MKKIAMLFIMLLSMAGLTACGNANANASDTSNGNRMTIKMELDKDYDDTDPLVNEMLFCVSEDLDTLSAEGTLTMDGENIILEVKNNKTKVDNMTICQSTDSLFPAFSDILSIESEDQTCRKKNSPKPGVRPGKMGWKNAFAMNC